MRNDFPGDFPPEAMTERLFSLGFCETGFLDLNDFLSGHLSGEADNTNRFEALREAGQAGMKTIMIAALPISTGNTGQQILDLSSSEDPHGLFAPFAWNNHYARAVSLIRKLEAEIRGKTGRTKKEFRIFVNSRFPEKPIAGKAGIGFIGKNTLLITPSRGSMVILGGMLLPFSLSDGEIQRFSDIREDSCGTCALCIRACPVKALSREGILDTSRCLQALSTGNMPGEFQDAWQTRLYGCQICQDVCPRNRYLKPFSDVQPDTFPGRIGPSFSLRKILQADSGVKELFKGTILDQRWIGGEFILRNALLAAGNHPYGMNLQPEIRAYLDHPNRRLSRAAEWALEKIARNGKS